MSSNNENENKNKNNEINSIKIFDINLSYLTIMTIICGIILSIIDFKYSKNKEITTPILFGLFISNAININCMTLGPCYYWSLWNVLTYVFIIIYLLTHTSDYINPYYDMVSFDDKIYSKYAKAKL